MVAPKLSLESYIQAAECAGDVSNLSKDDVRQVRYKPKKGELIELLRKIKLSVPGRSTIDERDVSPAAYLFAEEMRRDLALLNWEECQVESIQSFNQPAAAPTRERSSSLPVLSAAESKKNRRRRLEKMKKLAAGGTGSSTPMAIEALLSFSSSRGVIEIS